MAEQRVEIPGSAPKHLASGPQLSPVPASQQIEVSVVLRRDPATPDVGEELLAGTFQPASQQEAADSTQAAESDMEAVENFATGFDLQVVSSDAATRTIKLSGTAPQLDRAFGIKLVQFGNSRTYQGPLTVPQNLASLIVAVLGLDNRPIATHHAS